MDMNPIYELRGRLRAAAIAGTGLLSEDFRLKRAAEAMKPLEASSPVFAKIGQLMNALLSPDCPNPSGALLDTITLVDAVICTLGSVDLAEDVQPVEMVQNAKSIVVNAPHSELKNLLDALTTSGSGHYNFVYNAHQTNPELFQDYRIKYALIQALGATYSELADLVETWLKKEDESILVLLMRDFDPKGKKEMVRRVHVIESIAGAQANDFYLKMLENAQKEIRQALIRALQNEPENIELLLDMTKSEKGKNKQMAIRSLADIEDQRSYEFFHNMAEKKPQEVLGYIQMVSTDWASKLLTEMFYKALAEIEKPSEIENPSANEETRRVFINILASFIGKGGEDICACYRKLVGTKEGNIWERYQEMLRCKEIKEMMRMFQVDILSPEQYRRKEPNRCFGNEIGMILQNSLVVRSDKSLQALALELYETRTGIAKTNVNFLAAALTAKLVNGEPCAAWLKEQVSEKANNDNEYKKAAMDALSFIHWDSDKDSYMLRGYYHYLLNYEEDGLVERPIEIADSEELIAWLMTGEDRKMDSILSELVQTKDKEQCSRVGEYLYRRALVTTEDHYGYWMFLKKCGWTTCKGLGVRFVKCRQRNLSQWELYRMDELPGDDVAIREELQTIVELMKSGEIKLKNINLNWFENWVDKR